MTDTGQAPSIKTSSTAPSVVKGHSPAALPKSVSLNMSKRQFFAIDGLTLNPLQPTAQIPENLPFDSTQRIHRAIDMGILVAGDEHVPYISKQKNVLEGYLRRAEEARDVNKGLMPLVQDIVKSRANGNYSSTEILQALLENELKRTEIRQSFVSYLTRALQKIPGHTGVKDYVVPQKRAGEIAPATPPSPESSSEALSQI